MTRQKETMILKKQKARMNYTQSRTLIQQKLMKAKQWTEDILNFGLVSDTVFEGTLNYNFYSGAPDAEIIAWFDESLLAVDENYSYTQDGAAEWEVNDDGNVFTFTIRDNVNWHDGELLQLKTGHLQLKYLLIQTMMVFVMEM